MKVSKREQDGVTILDLEGKITIGAGDVALRDAVQEAVNAGAMKILLNMENVGTIDSSGIGEIVSAHTTVTNKGGKIRLCALPAKVADILQITQLITVLDVLDDVDEGIRTFQ